MRTSNFSRNHPYAKARGWVGPNRAAPGLPRVSDGVNEVDGASEIVVSGGTVSEPEDGVALITFGGLSGSSNSGGGGSVFPAPGGTPVYMRNNAAIDLRPGDVVIVDPDADSAVTTTATASNTRIVGVVQEPIGRLQYGPVLFNGLTSVINTTGSVSRGDYALTSGTAAQAGSTDERVAGSFAVFLTGSDFPEFVAASANTESSLTTTTLALNTPSVIPPDRLLLAALWLESSASSPTIDGWTRIGAESGFYYFYKVSDGDDAADASWTGASVAVASVLLLHPNAMLTDPVESHDYDSSTSAAAVSSLSDAPRYAIAGVQANVASPGSGFIRLGGGTSAFNSTGGTPALVQSNTSTPSGTSFSGAVTNGNVMVAVPVSLNTSDAWEVDPRQVGSCPVDVNMVQMIRGVNTGTAPGSPTATHAIGIQAKVISDGYNGPFQGNGACASGGALAILEFENIGISDYDTADDVGTDGPVDLGTFAGTAATDVVVMAIVFSNSGEGDPVVNLNGFTQIYDSTAGPGSTHLWVGYKIGNGDASVTLSNGGGQDWAAVAVKLTQGSHSAAGTLAGKYIGSASSATSPFSGASQQNDAVFALNLRTAAKPSALLYGPDLAGGTSGADDLVNHGSMGSTETINVGEGTWHRGTLNADCAITVAGFIPDDGIVAVFEVTQDGTGGRTITWDSDVVFIGSDDPDTTANTKTIFLLFSSAGDSVIYGAKIGGSSAADISDMGFVGEILVADTPAGSPLVFEDLLQNEAGTDLLYADVG